MTISPHEFDYASGNFPVDPKRVEEDLIARIGETRYGEATRIIEALNKPDIYMGTGQKFSAFLFCHPDLPQAILESEDARLIGALSNIALSLFEHGDMIAKEQFGLLKLIILQSAKDSQQEESHFNKFVSALSDCKVKLTDDGDPAEFVEALIGDVAFVENLLAASRTPLIADDIQNAFLRVIDRVGKEPDETLRAQRFDTAGKSLLAAIEGASGNPEQTRAKGALQKLLLVALRFPRASLREALLTDEKIDWQALLAPDQASLTADILMAVAAEAPSKLDGSVGAGFNALSIAGIAPRSSRATAAYYSELLNILLKKQGPEDIANLIDIRALAQRDLGGLVILSNLLAHEEPNDIVCSALQKAFAEEPKIYQIEALLKAALPQKFEGKKGAMKQDSLEDFHSFANTVTEGLSDPRKEPGAIAKNERVVSSGLRQKSDFTQICFHLCSVLYSRDLRKLPKRNRVAIRQVFDIAFGSIPSLEKNLKSFRRTKSHGIGISSFGREMVNLARLRQPQGPVSKALSWVVPKL
jgi:hypothetical protein